MRYVFIQLMLVFCALSGTSFAQTRVDPRSELKPVELIEIKAQYYPNEIYHLGYAENSDHSVNSIYYENNEHEKRFFSFTDLNGWVTIITNTTHGKVYDLVKLHAEPGEIKGNYDISMKFMTNGLFKWTEEAKFTLIYNSKYKVYQLKDENALHIVRKVYVTTNFWGKTPVGIEEIISSQ